MAKIAIQAVGLNKWFGEGEAKTHAVKDVSFEAYFGEILYVVGPSGSGKTTMLSMISGILRPNSGTVKIEGYRDLEAEQRCARRIPLAQDRLRFPGLSSLSAPHDRRERGDSAHSAKAQLGRGAQGGGDGSRDRRLEGAGAAAAGEAERRRTAARRHRPRDRQPPGHLDSRRAHRLARRRYRAEHRQVRPRTHSLRQALHRHRDPRQPDLRIRGPHREDGGREDDGYRRRRS